MEQAPSTTACRDVNPVKRPGVMRLWSWQAIAHGADAVLYFQMRASRGASEKLFAAVINHAGRDDTRTFREVAALGEELERFGPVALGARTPARVALLFDWDSWWALEISDGPSRLVRYQQVVLGYYQALWEAGVDVDVVPVTAGLTAYDVVVAPALHMVKGDLAERLEAVARRGGSVLATYLSGRVDEDDNAFLADVPGPLAPLMGVRIDEWDARDAGTANPVRLGEADGDGVESAARLVFEIVVPQGADVLGRYQADFYAGTPAVTRNAFGGGYGWYVATGLDQTGVDWVVRRVLDTHGIAGRHRDLPQLETAARVAPDGTRLLFLLNHSDQPLTAPAAVSGTDLLTGESFTAGGQVRLDGHGVRVLREL
jgi:beta-galactosidase